MEQNARIQMGIEELQSGITQVILEGRLDIGGASAIELKMSVVGGSGKAVLVDLRKVSYLASIGIGVLVSTARAIMNRGGKCVFYGPSGIVDQVLKMSGIYQVIPVHYELESAIAALNGNNP